MLKLLPKDILWKIALRFRPEELDLLYRFGESPEARGLTEDDQFWKRYYSTYVDSLYAPHPELAVNGSWKRAVYTNYSRLELVTFPTHRIFQIDDYQGHTYNYLEVSGVLYPMTFPQIALKVSQQMLFRLNKFKVEDTHGEEAKTIFKGIVKKADALIYPLADRLYIPPDIERVPGSGIVHGDGETRLLTNISPIVASVPAIAPDDLLEALRVTRLGVE